MFSKYLSACSEFFASRYSALTGALFFVLLAPTAALAQAPGQAGGISGLFGNLGAAVISFIELITIAAVGIGIAAVLYGLVMMIKKGTGRGEDIEWRQILWPMVGGAMATVVMFIVYALVAEVGAPQQQMGVGWGN